MTRDPYERFWLNTLASAIGIAVVAFFYNYTFITPMEERLTRSINKLSFPQTDECIFIKINHNNLEKLGLEATRVSDDKPLNVIWLYGCVNYKKD